ncbi:MAG: amidase family protein [Gammaproteobacteria bacterium]
MDPYDDLHFMSALDLRAAMLARELSPVELMVRTLERLEAVEPALNAFTSVMAEQAMRAAYRAQQDINSGRDTGALVGLPISVKDLLDVAGQLTSFGSKATRPRQALADAPCVERLWAAGAGILGKTTTSEFGCKPVGDSPLTGISRNPWRLSKTPGGSSAGAAASVAAGVTPFAIGTDGGGSIRIPAAFCGLVGIKGQFGRVPMYPASATPNLAHVGVLARTVRDAALLLSTISGFDGRDNSSLNAPIPEYLLACERPVQGMRIAWSPTLGYATPSNDVVASCEQAVDVFRELGCTVTVVDSVMVDPYAHWNAEFYLGVATRLKDEFDPSVADCLLKAREQTVEGYYFHSLERLALKRRMRRFFDDYDLLLTPTVPVTAFDTESNMPPELPNHDIFSWVSYTYPFNLTGQPAASVPCGFSGDGLPIGLQIVARSHAETDMFRAAAAYEAARPWTQIMPKPRLQA